MGRTELLVNKLASAENGWRKSWEGYWKDQAEGCVQICQGWSAVPCRKNPSSSEESFLLLWSCRSHCCCLQLCHPGVPDCRGAGHVDQGYHCWRWCHPPHPQVPHWQEGRGWTSSSPLTLTEQHNKYSNNLVSYRITSFSVEKCAL